jgi:thymidylate synthase
MEWPIYYKNILRVGNLESCVGVVTLWTERDVVMKTLEKNDFCAIGNLYAAAGINHMMRNIFANPRIRYLVMWGADMSQSGHALARFMQNGIDERYSIIGARGEIEREIPTGAVNAFRKHIQLIDLRGKPMASISQTIRSLKRKSPFAQKPRLFPPSQPKITSLPSESVGYRAEAATVAQTWLKILNLISKYGKTEKTRYASNNQLKEILNLTAVIREENPDEEYFPHYLPFSKLELKSYYPEMTTNRVIPGVAYNYGYRMRTYFKVDQIAEIKKLLARRPFSKKAIAVTYDVAKDWADVDAGDTPCLTQLLARISDGALYLTAHFRSQDMFHGWPRNAFALRKVQKDIANGVNLPMGPLTIITHSAHMYADDWKTAETILGGNYLPELKFKHGYHWHEDPRGNWLIDIDYEAALGVDKFYVASGNSYAVAGQELHGKIIAKLYTQDMSKELLSFEGRTAAEVYRQIADWELISVASHAFDLGEQLTKAEIALRLGLEYKSWQPLVFKMN